MSQRLNITTEELFERCERYQRRIDELNNLFSRELVKRLVQMEKLETANQKIADLRAQNHALAMAMIDK